MSIKVEIYYRSSCSARVRAALHYKGIAFETRPNPNGMVPMLVIDGHAISQSSAIIEYLEETRPEPALLPKDPWTRAQTRIICAIIGCDIQPTQNLRLLHKIGDTKAEWARHWITVGFTALEKELTRTAGKYCIGDQITMADLYLPPQVYNAHRFNVDMSQFPTITRIDANLASIEAFRLAHYSRQPDCPPELRAQD
ncbi:maleylacetoacetate isomerase [Syncephalis plumigaleata]|nr:maleylacetoacetate isomerase [Syncephalis plumigaleata]